MIYDFPIYRKYVNDKSFFRINSKENFDELILIGSFYIFRNQQAQILPEFVMIVDMIENANNHWLKISEEEFNEKLAYCQKELNEKTL
jgi:hypothetical protein